MSSNSASSQCPEEVLLPLPAPLKALLEDDCFWILRRDKLVRLPLPPELTVENILRDYYMSSLDGFSEDSNLQLLSEVLDGIKIYFDFVLADHLLYEVEKEQHRKLGILNPVIYSKKSSSFHHPVTSGNSEGSERGRVCPGSSPSQVYGCIHLLRLFVKLPHLLLCAQIPAGSMQALHIHFKDIIGYICSRRHNLFSEDHYYETLPMTMDNSNHNVDQPSPECPL